MSRMLTARISVAVAAVFGATAQIAIAEVAEASAAECPPPHFSTVTNFDIDSFVSKKWYIQQQMEVKYLPKSQNRCVSAEYSKKAKPNFWGYDVSVHNVAVDVAPPHRVHDSGSVLCAKVVDEQAGKLEVAPCFLPTAVSGDYWVLAYSESQGYALISGGAPTISAPGGCRTGAGVNQAGLWIFTREQTRNEALVQQVRSIAAEKGFDVSVLNDVDQSQCSGASALSLDAGAGESITV